MPNLPMPNCKECKFFRPKYYLVGECERQFSAGAKFWNSDSKPILVSISHTCSQFEAQECLDKDII